MFRDEELLPIREVARRLGLTVPTIRAWIWREKLPGAVKLGRLWRVPASTIEKLIREGTAR